VEQAVGPVLENARRAGHPIRYLYFLHLAPLIVNQAVWGGRDAPEEHLTFVEQNRPSSVFWWFVRDFRKTNFLKICDRDSEL